MFSRILLIIVSVMVSAAGSVAQASTRANTPLAMAIVENPASEMACLEAFVNSKFAHAFILCLPLAQEGMRDAQLVTGLMYAIGEGTMKNNERARLWLSEASRNGSEEAKEVLIDFNFSDKP